MGITFDPRLIPLHRTLVHLRYHYNKPPIPLPSPQWLSTPPGRLRRASLPRAGEQR